MWAWFKRSHTILWARLQMLGGFLVAAAAGMSWTPLLATGLTGGQLVSLGLVLLLQGIVTEAARRYKATSL